jgi:hypothetical protein
MFSNSVSNDTDIMKYEIDTDMPVQYAETDIILVLLVLFVYMFVPYRFADSTGAIALLEVAAVWAVAAGTPPFSEDAPKCKEYMRFPKMKPTTAKSFKKIIALRTKKLVDGSFPTMAITGTPRTNTSRFDAIARAKYLPSANLEGRFRVL